MEYNKKRITVKVQCKDCKEITPMNVFKNERTYIMFGTLYIENKNNTISEFNCDKCGSSKGKILTAQKSTTTSKKKSGHNSGFMKSANP